jgi:predicted peptidase
MDARSASIRRAAKGCLALVILAAAGCGSGGTAGTAPPPTSGSEAVATPVVAERLSSGLTLRPAGSVEGAPLGYAEYLPRGYGDGRARPLIVFLHGTEESGDGSAAELDDIFKLGIPKMIEGNDWPRERPFIVLMPQYPVSVADDCQMADQVDAFFQFALDHYDVDADRVYLTGVSCGAIGAWDYLASYGPNVVSAAVLISGHAMDALAEAGCDLGEVPLWVFHGAEDSIVPVHFVVDQMAELRACDPPPVDLKFTVYPGRDHNAWDPTYRQTGGHDIYAWLLEHEKT